MKNTSGYLWFKLVKKITCQVYVIFVPENDIPSKLLGMVENESMSLLCVYTLHIKTCVTNFYREWHNRGSRNLVQHKRVVDWYMYTKASPLVQWYVTGLFNWKVEWCCDLARSEAGLLLSIKASVANVISTC